MRSLLPILLVVACRQPEPEPACLFEVDGWFDSPARHVVYAGAGGDFGYATPAVVVGGVSGSWDELLGGWEAVTEYVDGYFLVSEQAGGDGSIEPDGDFGFVWSWERLDVLGEVTGAEVDEERCGCELTRRTEPWGEGSRGFVYTVATIQDADTVWVASTSEASEFDVTALHRSDASVLSSYEGLDGESWYEVTEPGDGTRSASFHLRYDGGTEDGGYVRDLAGTRAYTFDRHPEEGDWLVLHLWWLLHYDGSGQGEVVGEGVDGTELTCWYEWDAQGEGSYSCDDGTSGPY